MSAEEKVFSISDLRLYILQFAIENKEKKQDLNLQAPTVVLKFLDTI